MKLFDLEHNYPTIKTECLLIPEFKKIWDRDKTKNKDKAKNELAYIYFLLDTGSAYAGLVEEDREKQIVKDLFKVDSFKPDKDLFAAMQKYEQLSETPSKGLLKDARLGVEELRKFLRNVDLSERTKAGIPVFRPADITKALSDLDKVVDNLKKIEDRVNNEEYAAVQARGNVTGGALEFEED